MWDPSSPNRGRTRAHCIGSVESTTGPPGKTWTRSIFKCTFSTLLIAFTHAINYILKFQIMLNGDMNGFFFNFEREHEFKMLENFTLDAVSLLYESRYRQ